MNLTAKLRCAFDDLPQSRFLGMKTLDVGLDSGRSSMLLPFSTDLASRSGTIDWAATATLIDTAASLAVCAAIEGRSPFATIDLAMQRIAPLSRRPLIATAVVTEEENQVTTVAVQLHHDGEAELLGTARAGFWISDRRLANHVPAQDQIVAVTDTADEARGMQTESLRVDLSGFERKLNLGIFYSESRRCMRLPFQPRLTFNPVTGAIHGGFIAALLEYAATDHYCRGMPAWVPASALSVDFLRPARAGDLWAEVMINEASPTGRTITVDAWQGDRLRPIASAIATFGTDIRHFKC